MRQTTGLGQRLKMTPRKDIHREHDSGVPPVLPDVLFVHSDLLAMDGRGLIAPGELDKYEVDDC